MTTEADFTPAREQRSLAKSLIDAVPPDITHVCAAVSGALRRGRASDLDAGRTGRGCRVAEPFTELPAWLTDVPDHAVLLIYRAFLDCLNPR